MNASMNTFPEIRTQFVHWRDWELNPVLLKELRQAIRNPMLTGALMSLLTALFLVSVKYLAEYNLLAPGTNLDGLRIFQTFLAILTGISLVFVPLYTGIRLATELEESGFELMFVTALPIWRIIRGKFLSAAYLQIMFFSVFLPFMAFTGLLRGVDLPTIFFILICLYVSVCTAVQAAIALGYLPMHVFGKIGVGVLFAAALLAASRALLWCFSKILVSGIGTLVGTPGFWLGFIAFILLALGSFLVFYAISVVLAVKARYLRGYSSKLIRKALLIQS